MSRPTYKNRSTRRPTQYSKAEVIFENPSSPIVRVRRIRIPRDPILDYIENGLLEAFLPTSNALPYGLGLLSFSFFLQKLESQNALYPTVSAFAYNLHAQLAIEYLVYLLKGAGKFKNQLKAPLQHIAYTLKEHHYPEKEIKQILKRYVLSCESHVNTQEAIDHFRGFYYLNVINLSLLFLSCIESLYAQSDNRPMMDTALNPYTLTGISIAVTLFVSIRQAQRIHHRINEFLTESYDALSKETPKTILKPSALFDKEEKSLHLAHAYQIARDMINNAFLSILILIPNTPLRKFTKSVTLFGLYAYNESRNKQEDRSNIHRTLSPHYSR